MSVRILQGDNRDVLKTLPAASVHCCVTSPPYFGLRDYGTATWEGGDAECDHAKVVDRAAAVATSTLGGGKKSTGHLQEGFVGECGRCGARRIDSQIGLEATPEAFVAELVAVFREVRRVLRDDGTLWLNLGDSYCSTDKWGGGKSGNSGKQTVAADGTVPSWAVRERRPEMPGLKPKDLIGIPWRVAFALQQPYYSGRIEDINDRIWLAAMIDGEGCLFIHKRKAGTDSGARFTKADGTEMTYARTADTFGAGLEVANTHLAIIENCIRITGVGSVVRQEKDRRQPLYRWNVRSNECRWIVQEVYPHLIAKQHQARLLLGAPSSGERADAAHQALMGLHGGTPTDVNFKPPESLFQPGYYLRQDIIWSKLNPMPESVTDRCTKAHEYLFLLSKSARYHCDMAAIAEPAIWSEDVRAGAGRLTYDGKRQGVAGSGQEAFVAIKDTRNKRSVWEVATQPYSEAHFATFPPALIEPCIKAGCPEGGTVLDPFGGAGTTGLVADRLQRDAVLIELNPAYVEIAQRRIVGDAPLFAEVA